MSRQLLYVIVGFFLVLSSLVVDGFGYDDLSSILELMIVPAFTVIYFLKAKIKDLSYIIFISLYSVADIIRVIDLSRVHNITYYICNAMFIISYVFLISYTIRTINFGDLLKRFRFEIFILVLLIAYMIYALVEIVKPVSFEMQYQLSVQIFELLYNLVLMVLLIISFLNYIQNTSKKQLLLFIACAIIMLSELTLIGYYYISNDIKLSYLSTVLYAIGFLILFNQSQMKNTKTLFLSK